ncbi:hypothetical protein FMUND_12666 [Fusarium mundagurra]|uniref:F-box domain-containing protein n=1 Tax=Fusarium mundagurra TaxID=1567541 RepID=A0A8H5Y1V3_9HYPO|nr:hypothetical protein FMUND_12666 [Fusarium mundagurra]
MNLYSPLLRRKLEFCTPRFLAPCTTIKPRPASAVGLNDLPDETLMSIIHNIYKGTDKPSLFAFFALRQVSQRFRQLTQDTAFDSHLFSDTDCCEQCLSLSRVQAPKQSANATLTSTDLPLTREKHCFSYKAKKRGICLKGLDDFVRQGKICSTCQKGLEVRKRKGASLKCKFAPRNYWDWKLCIPCGAFHPYSCFSAGKYQCLARTGYIRLCEHVVISWYHVRSFVNTRSSSSEKTKKIMIMSCEDPSHYSPCSNGAGGPKAEMLVYATGGGLLLLTFTGNSDADLTPVQGIDEVPYGMDHRTGTMTLPMTVIYEAIQSVREKGGRHFAPERISGVLPELNGLNLEDISTDASSQDDPVKVIHPKGTKPPTHSSLLHGNPTQDSVNIVAEPCSHLGSSANHSCIKIRYQRNIRVGWAQMEGRIQESSLPSHDWFHAISRESYTYRGPSCVAETCHDKACRNYYAIASSRSHFATSEVELSKRPWLSVVTAVVMAVVVDICFGEMVMGKYC